MLNVKYIPRTKQNAIIYCNEDFKKNSIMKMPACI